MTFHYRIFVVFVFDRISKGMIVTIDKVPSEYFNRYIFEISGFLWSKCNVECAIYLTLISKSAQARCDESHIWKSIVEYTEFQHIWWKHEPKFLYFSLSIELSKWWLQWLPKHFFFWQVFFFIFVSFKQDWMMSSIVRLAKINTKFVEDVLL